MVVQGVCVVQALLCTTEWCAQITGKRDIHGRTGGTVQGAVAVWSVSSPPTTRTQGANVYDVLSRYRQRHKNK